MTTKPKRKAGKHVHRWEVVPASTKNMFPYVGCECGWAWWDEYEEKQLARILNAYERQKAKGVKG